MDATQNWTPARVDNQDADPLCHKPEAVELAQFACDKIKCTQSRSLDTKDFYDFQFKNSLDKTKAVYPDLLKIAKNDANMSINMASRLTTNKVTVRINSVAALDVKVFTGAQSLATIAASVAAIFAIQMF